jgi:ABC-type phosphate/phosphonate transport system substrate-binding protein
MLITLPMYDYPEFMPATEAWAAAIARFAGRDVALSRPDDYAGAWSRGDLAFSQTCGYPFTHAFRNSLLLIGTPHYAVPGCDGFRYSSLVVARERRALDDYRGCVAVVNTADSMSGMLALKSFFSGLARDGQFFGRAILSGGHVNSLAALQRGEADVCAIDAVCVAYVRRHRPHLIEGLHELGWTCRVPGLPYVTRDPDVRRWQDAVAAASVDPVLADVRACLMIGGFTVTEPSDYEVIPALEAEVDAMGGVRLLD